MREQVRIWRQQREQQAALEAQKRAEAAATQRPKTAPVKNRPLSAPTRRNMTPVRHISDPNDIALSANRKPLDSALHDKRVAEALQSQRSRAAAAEALKAKTKVCIISAFFYAIALRPCVFSPSRHRLGHLSCKPLVLLLRPKYQPQSNEFM